MAILAINPLSASLVIETRSASRPEIMSISRHQDWTASAFCSWIEPISSVFEKVLQKKGSCRYPRGYGGAIPNKCVDLSLIEVLEFYD